MTSLSARYRFIRGCCAQALRDHIVWQYQQIIRNNDQRTEFGGVCPAKTQVRMVRVTRLQDIALTVRALQRLAAHSTQEANTV